MWIKKGKRSRIPFFFIIISIMSFKSRTEAKKTYKHQTYHILVPQSIQYSFSVNKNNPDFINCQQHKLRLMACFTACLKALIFQKKRNGLSIELKKTNSPVKAVLDGDKPLDAVTLDVTVYGR